jgi:hypothetical protein
MSNLEEKPRLSRVSIAKEGVALVSEFWDTSKQIRIEHPEAGPERMAAFTDALDLLKRRLHALGLPYLPSLPQGRKDAMDEAYRRFLAVAGTGD